MDECFFSVKRTFGYRISFKALVHITEYVLTIQSDPLDVRNNNK